MQTLKLDTKNQYDNTHSTIFTANTFFHTVVH